MNEKGIKTTVLTTKIVNDNDNIAPRVKRPLYSLKDTFTGSLMTRLKWLVVTSIPIALTFGVQNLLIVSTSFAIVAGLVAYEGIPSFGRLLTHAGRTGKDLNKLDLPLVPESLGIAVGTIFLLCMFLFIPVPFIPWLLRQSTKSLFPFEQLGAYTAALLSISCMLLLGFADDVLNLKWRHKILIPALSSLPLLMIYAVTSGRTEVVVPVPLQSLLGDMVNLGVLYYVYMAMLAIFCTHSINILAGVNGVEVGQTLVIAICVIAHNILAIWTGEGGYAGHAFSLSLILPFAGVNLALLLHNWYPASVFVGDTFCYFAGMTLAVAGILGHFSKTLLLFFMPQIFNFLYSAPQLFSLIPCPRHRLPKLNKETGLLEPSMVVFEITKRNSKLLKCLEMTGMIKVYEIVKDKKITTWTTNNFTLLNLLLVKLGPMREDRLAIALLTVQITSSLFAFTIRHYLAGYLFP